MIDDEVYDLLLAADLAEKGSWPVAGGWLDQTRACIEGIKFVWAEEAHWRAEVSDG